MKIYLTVFDICIYAIYTEKYLQAEHIDEVAMAQYLTPSKT